jgi:hypothetical protein
MPAPPPAVTSRCSPVAVPADPCASAAWPTTQLTDDDVHDGHTVTMTFGCVPIARSGSLADLVRELVAIRKSSNIIAAPDAQPWLFPGKRPGHPIGDDALGHRLQRIGLNPRQDRSTALFALATELPAAILGRTLGINIKVAVAWQRATAGDWTVYAANISRRPRRELPP